MSADCVVNYYYENDVCLTWFAIVIWSDVIKKKLISYIITAGIRGYYVSNVFIRNISLVM